MTKSTVHIFNIHHWKKYCCYIANIYITWAYRPDTSAHLCQHNQLQCLLHITATYVPETNMPPNWICHFDGHIWRKYTHIYAIYKVTGINHVTRSTVHIFEIYQWKHDCHGANIAHTANMPHRHIQVAHLYIYAQNTTNYNIYFTCKWTIVVILVVSYTTVLRQCYPLVTLKRMRSPIWSGIKTL